MTRWMFAVFLVLVPLLSGMVSGSQDKVVFLDVGQGDAVLMQSGNKQVLVDGGRGTVVLERLGEEMPWFDRSVEVVVATHADRDHLEGLVHVLDRYEVGLVLLPRRQHGSQLQDAWLDELLERLEAKQVEYRFAWAGQELTVGDLTLAVLGPEADEDGLAAGSNSNNASVLLRADMHDMSFLLTGDAEAVVERKLVGREDDLDVDVLKVGHHGSKTSTTAELLKAASPAAAVISVGADNRFGHPHETVLTRLQGVPTWRTDEDGSVRFVYVDDEWLIEEVGPKQ